MSNPPPLRVRWSFMTAPILFTAVFFGRYISTRSCLDYCLELEWSRRQVSVFGPSSSVRVPPVSYRSFPSVRSISNLLPFHRSFSSVLFLRTVLSATLATRRISSAPSSCAVTTNSEAAPSVFLPMMLIGECLSGNVIIGNLS